MIVIQEEFAPRGIAKPVEMRGRIDDIGDEDGGEHAIPIGWRRIDPRTGELDGLVSLVTDNPGIVTGGNVIDIIHAEFAHFAGFRFHAQRTFEHDA